MVLEPLAKDPEIGCKTWFGNGLRRVYEAIGIPVNPSKPLPVGVAYTWSIRVLKKSIRLSRQS